MTTDRHEWTADAACRAVDPAVFFPEGSATVTAKALCGACAVRSDCLAYAIANEERFGIWGGLSARERMGRSRRQRVGN